MAAANTATVIPQTITSRPATAGVEHRRETRARVPRSCTTCRSRKIKCDKSHPCGACRRSNFACVFPEQTRRPPRPRRQDKALVERLERLEGLIQELSGKQDSGVESSNHGVRGESEITESVAESSDGVEASSNNTAATPLGKLVISDGRSRYIGPNFWGSISEEVEDLKSLFDSSSDEECRISPIPGMGSFLFRSIPTPLGSFHPTPADSRLLYDIYVFSVDPVLRVLHKPTFQEQLALFQTNTHHPSLPKSFEALIFSVYYAAITSIHPTKVLSTFGAEKNTLLQRYRCAVEESLANSRFLQSEELTSLQALVIFISCIRIQDPRTSCRLCGLAIRMAQSLGLHKDPSHFNLPPLETELRRRLWYEVCILELRTAEEHGSDPMLTPASYNTRLPLNINDSDISASSTEPPKEREGFTEMTFLLFRAETLDCFRVLARTPSGRVSLVSADITNRGFEEMTVAEKEKMIHDFYLMLEKKYFQNLDMNVPIQMICGTGSRIMMGRALMYLYHPLRHYRGGELLSRETKDKLFTAALQSLEYSLMFASSTMTSGCVQWNWFFQTFSPAHATAVILSEISEMSPPETPEERERIEKAWKVVTDVLGARDLWMTGRVLHNAWRPLEKLKKRACSNVKRILGESCGWEGKGEETSFSGSMEGVDMTDSSISFDLQEWDDMFQYVKMDFA